MEIQLDRIEDEPLNWKDPQELPPGALERLEVVALTPVSWRGTVSPVGGGYLFDGQLSYAQTLTCPRCLGTSEVTVETRVELLVRAGASQPTMGDHELEASDLGELKIEGKTLDTQPILMEQLQLNVPMHPLCREDCAGLCPHCGADLNRTTCECDRGPEDPRWAALGELRDRFEE
jgi:uncharacterized protein